MRTRAVGALLSVAALSHCGEGPRTDLAVYANGTALVEALALGESSRICLTSDHILAVTDSTEEVAIAFVDSAGASLGAPIAVDVYPAAREAEAELTPDNPRFAYFGPTAEPRHRGRFAIIPDRTAAVLARGERSRRTSRIDLSGPACPDPWPQIHWDAALKDDALDYAIGDATLKLLVAEDVNGNRHTSVIRKSVDDVSNGTALIALDWLTTAGGVVIDLSARKWIDLESHRVISAARDDPEAVASTQLLYDEIGFAAPPVALDLVRDPAMRIEDEKAVRMTVTVASSTTGYEVVGQAFQYDYLDAQALSPHRLRVVSDAEGRVPFGGLLGFSHLAIDRCATSTMTAALQSGLLAIADRMAEEAVPLSVWDSKDARAILAELAATRTVRFDAPRFAQKKLGLSASDACGKKDPYLEPVSPYDFVEAIIAFSRAPRAAW